MAWATSPTRLEGMEIFGRQFACDILTMSPTRLEGMEISERFFKNSAKVTVSDPP